MYAVEILRDVAHTLKRNGESFIRHQRLASLKSEKFASELQAISNRANSSGIDIGNIEKNKKNYDLLNDVLHINGFLNAVSYSLNETSKEYGNFLDKFEHQLSDVVAKMELSFARKLKGAFDEHEKVFNQLAPCREKLAKLHQLPEEKQESPGKAKEIDRYEILENKRESQLKGTTSMLLDRCKCFLRENEPRVRMAIFAYKVAESTHGDLCVQSRRVRHVRKNGRFDQENRERTRRWHRGVEEDGRRVRRYLETRGSETFAAERRTTRRAAASVDRRAEDARTENAGYRGQERRRPHSRGRRGRRR